MKEKLILLHGALGSKDQLVELGEHLSDQYDIFSFNFSGHGGDTTVMPYSIDLFVQDTIDFMQGESLEKAHFFGYSMGGYVALKLAHGYPARAGKIITLGTKYKWDPESAAKEGRMMNPEIIGQKIPAFAATLDARHQPGDWKSIMNRTGEMMTTLGDGAAMTSTYFSSIENEVLICIGTDDHMVGIAESETTASLLPHGHLKMLEGFRHPLESVDIITLSSVISGFIG
ncbi:MAG: alpha/beta fold hydrolase [Saprospiraceae bacterium]|nr:alpha/beta fold hydrolase [Candidatus Opimibacter iunctus]